MTLQASVFIIVLFFQDFFALYLIIDPISSSLTSIIKFSVTKTAGGMLVSNQENLNGGSLIIGDVMGPVSFLLHYFN